MATSSLWHNSLTFEPVVAHPDLCAVVVQLRADGRHEVFLVDISGEQQGTPTTWPSLEEALVAVAAMLPNCAVKVQRG